MNNFYEICSKGDVNHVSEYIKEHMCCADDGLLGACFGGHMDIVKLMIEKYRAGKWKDGFDEACKGGHLNIVKLMIVKYCVNYWKDGFNEACKEGHIDIVKFIVDRGYINIYYGFMMACRYGHMNIINMLIKYSKHILLKNDCLNNGLMMACHGNHIDIIIFLINIGANDFGRALAGTLCGTLSSKPKYICTMCEDLFDCRINDMENGYYYSTDDIDDLYTKYVSTLHRELNQKNIDVLKLLINKGVDISRYYKDDHINNYKDSIKLLQLGLNINVLHLIFGYDVLVNKLNQFKEATYNELYQYIPKELAKLVSDYCLL